MVPPLGHTPREFRALKMARDAEESFLAWRDDDGCQQILMLGDRKQVTIGRLSDRDIVLTDAAVSREHCMLFGRGSRWRIRNDSTNGTFVAAQRILEPVWLQDDDKITVGPTMFLFGCPPDPDDTDVAHETPLPKITEREQDVLVELCRPLFEAGKANATATTKDIAERLHRAPSGVSEILTRLYAKFDITGKDRRTALALHVMKIGIVSRRHL